MLLLNASDKRGIDTLRTVSSVGFVPFHFVGESVKEFIQTRVSEEDGIPPYKIVILDEADAVLNTNKHDSTMFSLDDS